VRTVKNVDTVNDLVLCHKGALNCEGDRHSSRASVRHYSSGFSIKMSLETGAQELTMATVDCHFPLMLQGRVGAHKLEIHVLMQISSGMLLPKIVKIGSRINSFCKNRKGIVFFETVYMCVERELCVVQFCVVASLVMGRLFYCGILVCFRYFYCD